MKIKFLLILSLIFVDITLYAQEFALGLSLPVKYKQEAGLRNNLLYKGIGVTGVKSICNSFFVQADINYLQTNTSYNVQDALGLGTVKYNYNFLSLPLTINYKVFKRKGLNLLLSAGLNFDYLFKLKTAIDSPQYGKLEGKQDGGVHVLLDLGIGVYIPITESYFILVKPQFLYRVNKKGNDGYRFTSPHDFGLKLQVLRNFKS